MTTNSLYSSYIAKSRYARYLPDKKRREHWEETVTRYMDFMCNHVSKNHNFLIKDDLYNTLKDAIKNLNVMPSMRAMMTAGNALERDNTAGYNCAYLVVDDPKAFDEAMFILMCGTGIGFSVEAQYVDKLPDVPDTLYPSDTTIVFKDSKEGWAKGFRQFLALLYAGEIPKRDLSRLRKAGARLKTFGGRSSGPEPLNELLDFVIRIFKNAEGRKLTSLECHDIMCKIGETIVVGGVRRSAMISLSDLSDYKLQNAKSGAWWETNPQRTLSNNSAVYPEKPDIGLFMKEWVSLYESKSGERGIFNRDASRKQVERFGRRDPDHDFGTNPCSEIILRPYQFCNLTEVVVRASDNEKTLLEKVRIATIMGTIQSTLTDFPYLRKIWKKNTEEERLLGVSLTGIYDNPRLNNWTDSHLPELLEKMRQMAVDTNKEWADKLGIPQSAAITCIKPSGTVSQLVDSASGIHPRHAPYYFRRVRSDNKDPITNHLMNTGVPFEPDVMKPMATTVFTFPMRAPEGAITRDDITALDHLKLWMIYQEHWCEHKPSVTISVKEHEWMEVGAFVYKNFDTISGISFLPYDGGIYKQAPYEQCSEIDYAKAIESMPIETDWNQLVEEDDNVEGIQLLACSAAGGCEL